MSIYESLPHVCSGCNALRVGDVWTPKRDAEALPPRPHSHGMCPACVAKYRAENEQLARVAKAHSRKAGRVPTGGFRI